VYSEAMRPPRHPNIASSSATVAPFSASARCADFAQTVRRSSFDSCGTDSLAKQISKRLFRQGFAAITADLRECFKN
jgi:hypothetical protein